MVNAFPRLRIGKDDRNPAILLFGRRFFADQTVTELLVELLLVASTPKRIGDQDISAEQALPPIQILRDWPEGCSLKYAARACLNLKLFAFLGASKLETRHSTHRQHYRELLSALNAPDKLLISKNTDRLEVLRTLENLFLGFQGVGGSRTWCAQSFFPLTKNLIAGESIWRATRALSHPVNDWENALDYFSHSQQIFLARGGELLYLQICNALSQNTERIKEWCQECGIILSPRERNPELLHEDLSDGMRSVLNACPETVDKLATFIDSTIEGKTSQHTDYESGTRRYAACGWCAEESWREGLLFATELVHLCQANIDPVERIELLEIACALQLLRSLCAQSARYTQWAIERVSSAGAVGFVWAVSDPDGDNEVLKQISRRSVIAIQRMIYDAIRYPDISAVVDQQRRKEEEFGRKWQDPYREADSRYGYKLFLVVAKRIGLVVPKRGAGARFVLNNRLLRCIVLSLIPPGGRVRYETFKSLMYSHFGMAVDDDKLGSACEWGGTGRLSTLGGCTDAWLSRMLDAAGMLIRLADAYSLVTNPFDDGGRRL
jgi:hypothetical protein